jgi:hypothetical protein
VFCSFLTGFFPVLGGLELDHLMNSYLLSFLFLPIKMKYLTSFENLLGLLGSCYLGRISILTCVDCYPINVSLVF